MSLMPVSLCPVAFFGIAKGFLFWPFFRRPVSKVGISHNSFLKLICAWRSALMAFVIWSLSAYTQSRPSSSFTTEASLRTASLLAARISDTLIACLFFSSALSLWPWILTAAAILTFENGCESDNASSSRSVFVSLVRPCVSMTSADPGSRTPSGSISRERLMPRPPQKIRPNLSGLYNYCNRSIHGSLHLLRMRHCLQSVVHGPLPNGCVVCMKHLLFRFYLTKSTFCSIRPYPSM